MRRYDRNGEMQPMALKYRDHYLQGERVVFLAENADPKDSITMALTSVDNAEKFTSGRNAS